jgi:hypothetical protein
VKMEVGFTDAVMLAPALSYDYYVCAFQRALLAGSASPSAVMPGLVAALCAFAMEHRHAPRNATCSLWWEPMRARAPQKLLIVQPRQILTSIAKSESRFGMASFPDARGTLVRASISPEFGSLLEAGAERMLQATDRSPALYVLVLTLAPKPSTAEAAARSLASSNALPADDPIWTELDDDVSFILLRAPVREAVHEVAASTDASAAAGAGSAAKAATAAATQAMSWANWEDSGRQVKERLDMELTRRSMSIQTARDTSVAQLMENARVSRPGGVSLRAEEMGLG